MSIYEINAANVKSDVDTGRIKSNSPVVEVFSALTAGKKPNVSDKVLDKSVNTVKELASKAAEGDPVATSEVNAIVRLSIEPKLLEAIKLFNFMGNYKRIGYNEQPMMRTYKYESIGARYQASSGDVPFGAYSFREYPIPTQTISSGFAVDYRELQSGNFDGNVAEGMSQVQIDMQNKAVYYVVAKLYEALSAKTGIKHYGESDGLTKESVDEMLKTMRRYGKVNICGDYSVVSQLNGFTGYQTIESTHIPFGSAAVADEIRKTGLISLYNGAYVTELPNALDLTKLNSTGDDYDTYLPQGLLFFIPNGSVSPLQAFLRGGLTSMTGEDIVTRQRLTRFDMEFGAGVADGMEHQIGLLSDTHYEAPTV